MLFTVSIKASSFGGLSNIGSTKTILFSGFDQNAQINLLTCRISELMAGSQYPQTTRSLLKIAKKLATEELNLELMEPYNACRLIHLDEN